MVNLQEGLELPWLHVMSVNFCIKNKILLGFPLSFKFYILLLRKQKDLIWQSNCYEIVMIYSSTFFYLFFVFFSSSSSSLYFDKFKVFVHFEFVFSQRCLTLLYLGPYWLRKKYSDIILTKILRKHNTKLDPNHRITKCCPAKW